jgi:hypothetical protein
LEGGFQREVVESLKTIDSTYSEWMVILTYEVEKKPVTVQRPVPRRPKSSR